MKNFPAGLIVQSFFVAGARYFWHLVSLRQQKGKAADFLLEGHSVLQLPLLALRAHLATLGALPHLVRQRRRIHRRLAPKQFRRMLTSYAIGPREVAAL
jgi:hypothetical protein